MLQVSQREIWWIVTQTWHVLIRLQWLDYSHNPLPARGPITHCTKTRAGVTHQVTIALSPPIILCFCHHRSGANSTLLECWMISGDPPFVADCWMLDYCSFVRKRETTRWHQVLWCEPAWTGLNYCTYKGSSWLFKVLFFERCKCTWMLHRE